MDNTITQPTSKKLLLLLAMIFISISQALAAPPAVVSFSPTSGPVGTSVTIIGSGFNTTAANNIVFFGATMAQVTAASATSLTVTVPNGATYQAISVLNGSTHLIGYSAKPFAVTFNSKNVITANDIADQVDFTSSGSTYTVVVSDIDGDGKADIILANANANSISVFRNTSVSGSITISSFAAKVDFATGLYPTGLAVGDIDGDGKPDVVISNQSANTVSVLRNSSTPGTINFDTKVDFATGSGPGSVVIADFDGDGKSDLAVTNNYGNSLSVLQNNSVSGIITSSSFTAHVDYTTDLHVYSLTAGDLDGDGKPEIIVDNISQSTISIYHNQSASGSISFAAKVDFATGAQPENVAIGDLDGDGKPDMVVSNFNGNSISILQNTSTSIGIDASTFSVRVDIATNHGPEWVAIGDIDGDGKPDLAVTNNNGGAGNTVSLFRNLSTGGTLSASSFAAKVDFTVGSAPGGVAIADLDGDGKPDIIVPSNLTPILAVLRNSPLHTPDIPASNIIFTGTTYTYTTATWTNGNGTSRRVFVYAGVANGTPTPVNGTPYTGVSTFLGGNEIDNTGWYCVYNGTGNTVDISGLNLGSAYTVMVMEYNGTPGNEQYLTTAAAGNPATITTISPVIASSGIPSALSTVYGTASAVSSFNVSGTNLVDGITVTPPEGYEVSDNPTTGFADNVVIGGAGGDLPSTPVYIRLSATAPAAGYSGVIALSSSYATEVDVTAVPSTVSKAPLTISVGNTTKAYGTALTSGSGFTAFTATGLQNGQTIDSITITYITGGTIGAPVANYTGAIVPSAPIGQRPFTETNYNITYTPGDITVTPIPLTITATGSPKPYGTALTAGVGTNFTHTPTLSGDTVTSVTLTPDAAGIAANTPAGATYQITPSAATGLGGFLAGNYTITYVPYNGTVSKSALTINATGVNKTFDNTTNATVTLTDNRVSGDVFTTNYTATFADKNVGTGKPVNVTGITINGAAAANYTVNATATTMANITTAPVTVTAQADSKVYTKTTTSTVAPVVSGLLGTDAASTPAIQTFNNSNVGTGKTLTASGLIINDGNSGNNYAITYVSNTSGVITPAVATVTAQADTKVYSADVVSTKTPVVTGLLGSDAVSATLTQTFNSSSVGTDKTLTASGLVINDGNSGNNYSINYVPNTTGAITAATLTYTAVAASRNAGTANPAFTGTVTGFVGSDTQTLATTGTLSFITSATTNSPAGSYDITGTGLSAANYVFIQAAANSTALTVLATTSANAMLSNLAISSGSLSPVFIGTTQSYTAAVDNSISNITLTPTLADAAAAVKINGVAVNNGLASGPIALNVGDNIITTVVTAQDGITKKTYTLTVTRADLQKTAVVPNNFMSPNGDGKNDTWVVQNILNYPNNTVTVFDKTGKILYQKKGYTNDWDGTYHGAVLNEDTYYYAIDLGPGQGTVKGFITILTDK
ncbi:FG-GAP-like repeat-containing protein [Mucilaginibacter sp. dw_454]|uniref:FG-GAP-like repeat-containing protein n=1 Tax=Mucilaginibacter sp. dw_454 TaxID=2720079 RepID=UPI001BD32CF9|nr:FG-GAP-like repeat-containing protein [Mucilaginibacter sp. dw_454]